jgi:hypothetical protein
MQYTRILAGAATLLFASQAFADVPAVKKADEKKTEPSKEDAAKSDSKKVEAGKDTAVKTDVGTEDPSKADDGDPRKKEHAAAKKASAKDAAAGDPYAVEERENYTYRFLGAQYRAHIVPKFLVEAFVKQGGGLTSHEIGIHYEVRRGGMSVIPSLSYIEYGTSKDILFLEKGKPDGVEGNWSVINSSLKSVNGQVDVLWSAKIDKGVDFEYGLGVGMGVVFDKLMINWVYEDTTGKGQYKGNNGKTYNQCQTENQGPNPGTSYAGCTKAGHSNADVAKVGGYNEPNWFNGGYKPVLLPVLTPEFGFRFKPSKEFSSRFSFGWGLTGPWFGFSGSYGFAPAKRKPKVVESDLYEQ